MNCQNKKGASVRRDAREQSTESAGTTLDQLLETAVKVSQGQVVISDASLRLLEKRLKTKAEQALGPGDQLRLPSVCLKKSMSGVVSVSLQK